MNIVITGASSGIGFATALAVFKKNGNRVFAISRSKERLSVLKETCEATAADGKIIPIQFDITSNEAEFRNILFSEISKNCGTIDVIINNAGLFVNKLFEQTGEELWAKIFATNLMGPVRLIKTLLPLLRKAKNPHIINIGSMGGFQGSEKFPGFTAYTASKSALIGLTECLAREFRDTDKHISVNCICPGTVRTKMQSEAFPDKKATVTAEEIGEFVAQFALNGSSLFNGKIIPVALETP
ncbi:MAG: SDR family oxidoreductase [Candidatus Aenigmarchaeota archaeon]|nr:SDR family oxidoreductase [Candidatus Aenigmarchaeota archaeon]